MALDGRFAAFGKCVDRCESFIERQFLVALLFSEEFSFEPLPGGTQGIAVDSHGVILGQQITVLGYRLDFAMRLRGTDLRVAIELDGFRYHDATPEQATRDRSRDRDLVAKGWRVLRWTSREIIQDSMTCARQAHEIVLQVPVPPNEAAQLAKAVVRQLELPTARSVG